MHMQLPQARVVKHGGQLYAPPPPAPTRRPGQLKEQLHDAAALAIGLWPLVAVMGLMVAMLIAATNWNAP
jgi:hypothetical protein